MEQDQIAEMLNVSLVSGNIMPDNSLRLSKIRRVKSVPKTSRRKQNFCNDCFLESALQSLIDNCSLSPVINYRYSKRNVPKNRNKRKAKREQKQQLSHPAQTLSQPVLCCLRDEQVHHEDETKQTHSQHLPHEVETEQIHSQSVHHEVETEQVPSQLEHHEVETEADHYSTHEREIISIEPIEIDLTTESRQSSHFINVQTNRINRRLDKFTNSIKVSKSIKQTNELNDRILKNSDAYLQQVQDSLVRSKVQFCLDKLPKDESNTIMLPYYKSEIKRTVTISVLSCNKHFLDQTLDVTGLKDPFFNIVRHDLKIIKHVEYTNEDGQTVTGPVVEPLEKPLWWSEDVNFPKSLPNNPWFSDIDKEVKK